ncbi:hypothetical protein IP81_16495 [Novosphingobium sp. AAP83]|uniref:hypothetical protein n=1 Tax=Novosphingobium sp. AAP83 TaxID=1523425 RepID=UPI0006B99B81|nr:hypothetical protein [Novosphingobium sp. AAP83]KPF89634.1 hypothetical protein IP81_16495 [Novosphingobium sp. AAP83]
MLRQNSARQTLFRIAEVAHIDIAGPVMPANLEKLAVNGGYLKNMSPPESDWRNWHNSNRRRTTRSH